MSAGKIGWIGSSVISWEATGKHWVECWVTLLVCEACCLDSSVPFLHFTYPVSVPLWFGLEHVDFKLPVGLQRRCQVGNRLCAFGAGGACPAGVHPRSARQHHCAVGEPLNRREAVCSSVRWEQHHLLSSSGLSGTRMWCSAQCLRGEPWPPVTRWAELGTVPPFESWPCVRLPESC